MKKIKVIVLITILSFTHTVFSQTTSAPAGNNPTLKEAAIKANQQKQLKKNSSSSTPSLNSSKKVETIPNNFQVDENDNYQGRREEFLSQMIVKEIPNDFPKYEKWMGVRHYNEIIEEYYKKHLDIVTDKVKNKLLRK